MSQIAKNLSLPVCGLLMGLLLSACGGGDGSPPPQQNQTTGWAVDGYLQGAAVLCDTDGNGVPSAGEVSVATTSAGLFSFPKACSDGLVVTGGTNADTKLPFTGTLRAAAGNTMATPLTTLMAHGLDQEALNTSLGLPAGTDLRHTDPAATDGAGELLNPVLYKKTLAVQQLMQKTSEMLNGLGAAPDRAALPAVYNEVAAAFAAHLKGGARLNLSDSTLDAAVVGSLIKAATQRVATAPALSQPVRDGVQPLNADALAGTTAGGMKVQAEAILKATTPQIITEVTKAQQSDTQITTYAVTNKAALSGNPTAESVAAMSTALTQQVTASQGSGGGVTPPPAGGATLLVSFDEANPAFSNMGAYGGALPSVQAGPAGGNGNALKILKPTGAMDNGQVVTWGGVYFTTAAIPFAADRKTITARVNSTRAGAVFTFKVESSNGGPPVEVASTPTGAANTWSTVTWVLSGVDVAKKYTSMAITPDVSTVTTGQSYYVDQITLAEASAVIVPPPTTTGTVLLSFDEASPAFSDMGAYGGALPTVDAGPAGGSGNALKILKPVSPDTWGGAFFKVAKIPFTADRTTLSARVISTRAGAVVTLKVEIAGGTAVEVAGTATGAANTWTTVKWDLGAVDVSKAYTVMAITPDVSVVTTGQSYFIDTISLEPAAAVVPPPAPGAVFLSFDENTPAFSEMGAYGGAQPTVDAGPVGGAGKALKILKPVSPDTWGGTFFTTAKIPFTADNKAISARVYSTKAAAVIRFKVEIPGGTSVEVPSAPTGAANTWSTVTWDFAAVDLSKSYKIMAITPDADLVTSGKVYYIDEIKVVASGGGSGGGSSGGGGGSSGGSGSNPGGEMGSGGPQTMTVTSGSVKTPNGGVTLFVANEGIFAANFEGSVDPVNGQLAGWTGAKTVSYPGVGNIAGGSVGYFQDDVTLSTSTKKVDEGGWVSGASIDANGVPNFFRYFIMNGPSIPTSWMGLYANAPNNGTVNVSAFSRIKFRLWGPAEMYEKTYRASGLEVVLAGPKVAGCGTGSGGTEIAQTFTATQTIGAASQYKLPLSGFTVKGVCGSDTNSTAVAAVLAKLARVVVTVPGTAFNFTIPAKDSSPPAYPIGLNLGAIGFTNLP